MCKIFVFLSLLLFFPMIWAQNPPPSIQLPEKKEKPAQDENSIRFSSVVKIVREGQDEIQVFFEGQPNYYILNLRNSTNAGKYSQLLVGSMKNKTSIPIEADKRSRRIKKVGNHDEDEN